LLGQELSAKYAQRIFDSVIASAQR
jgi:hypothetical protein